MATSLLVGALQGDVPPCGGSLGAAERVQLVWRSRIASGRCVVGRARTSRLPATEARRAAGPLRDATAGACRTASEGGHDVYE
jgi:hypothetical protein